MIRLAIFSVILGIAAAHAHHYIVPLKIDEYSLREKECFDPPTSEQVGLDLKWFGAHKKWYVPLWSKFYAARTIADLFGKESDEVHHSELGPSSCLVFKDGTVITGYGKYLNYTLTGDTSSFTFKAHWPGAKGAKFQFHMTDNKNYLLGVTCWEDNQAGWAVITTKPYLDIESRAKIITYAKSLGFKEGYYIDEDYAHCGEYRLVPYYPYVSSYPSHFGAYYAGYGRK